MLPRIPLLLSRIVKNLKSLSCLKDCCRLQDLPPMATAAGHQMRILLMLSSLQFMNSGCADPSADSPVVSAVPEISVPSSTTDPMASQNVSSPQPEMSPLAASDSTKSSQPLTETAIHFAPLIADLFPQVVPQNGSHHGYATILESLGSGGAAVDVDADGLTDALIAGGGDFSGHDFVGQPVFFLRNRCSWFTDNTKPAGLSVTRFYHHGIAAADYDHDGFQDLLILGYGGLQFFRNLGDGTYEEISNTAELTVDLWTASAAWGDFNRDGHLDVYVATYVNWSFENDPPCFAADGVRRDNCSPKLFDALPDQLFLNLGDGRFSNATDEFGVRGDGKALGVVAADLDLDGFVDVYVGNDVMSNFLYQNDSGRRFVDRSISSGAGVSLRGSPDASMGVEAADYNLDGRPDLWAANFEMESFALYQNQGNMLFRHMSDSAGISAIGEQYVGWGSVFSDFDLDGDEDLCVCNGNVVRYPEHSPALQRMLLMENMDGEYFREITALAGNSLLTPRHGRGLAVLDWNTDGLPDLLVTPTESSAVVYTNVSESQGNWLTLELIGVRSPRQPIGATVKLSTSAGPRFRQLKGGGSYASTSHPQVHFGIPLNATVSELRIRWPAGSEQVINNPTLNMHHRIVEVSDR